eukprot:3608637-Pyramimonas_sp.AAC.1
MAGTGGTIDMRVKCVDDMFGKCKLNYHTCTNCAVRYANDEDGNFMLDQDEYIQQLHPIQPSGADADAQASKMVADMLVSLRGRAGACINHPGVVDGAC